MKIVQVTYTTTADYAGRNKTNIQAVMQDLQQLNQPGINYHCCVGADDRTFTHTAFFETENDQKVLAGLESFKYFQAALKESGPEAGPRQELLTLVGTSKQIF